MSGANIQILELAKKGLSAAEIAEALGYEVEAVEFVLQHDAEIARELEKVGYNKVEAEFATLEDIAIRTLKELLLNGENDGVRMKATAYVMDQRLGLKKPKQEINVFNVCDFNDRLKAVRERRQQLEQSAIDVESKLVTV